MASSPFARSSYEIQSPRLIIRTPSASDAEAYYKLLTTPENFSYEEAEQGLTLERLRVRIGRFAESVARGENSFMVIALRETGQLIGHGGYNTFESVELGQFLSISDALPGKKYMTDLGIMLDYSPWRKGYGLELLSALVEYARGELGCELFRAETGTDNEPWRALMRSAGLAAFEGRHKASYDENLDVWVWKFDAGHWEQAKQKMEAEGKWPL